jgi:hypothetical protein
MEEIGFVDVVQKVFAWPGNTWPKQPKMKVLGQWCLRNGLEGVESVSMAMLTRAGGLSGEEVERFLGDVKRDMRDRRIHSYVPV